MAGSGNEAYILAFEEIVEPAVAGFEPDLLIVGPGSMRTRTTRWHRWT